MAKLTRGAGSVKTKKKRLSPGGRKRRVLQKARKAFAGATLPKATIERLLKKRRQARQARQGKG